MDRSFLLRRLHSLSGIVPVGGYLCFHIFENLAALRGPAAYDEMVRGVNTMLPPAYFHALEGLVVLGPLLFHAFYGFYIAGTGQQNTSRYAYGSNWAYWFQRLSGYVAFIYLLAHVGVLRIAVTMFGRHIADVPAPEAGGMDLVTYADVAGHLGNPAYMSGPFGDSWMAGTHMFLLYVVGTLLTIFHFTNGLNGFCWTWGIAVGRVAQRRVQAVAWGLFAVLTLATLNILFRMRGIL